jgi:hypothetical protein
MWNRKGKAIITMIFISGTPNLPLAAWVASLCGGGGIRSVTNTDRAEIVHGPL